MKVNSDSQYLGHCRKCEKHTAVIESFCNDCRKKYKKEFESELIKMGFEL